ncbi:MAG: hypothetical protein QME90_06065 [Thermodesulfobacteriota bacterium]|nr:hypothetical protein [Thermodesulfobacteriota bacterium]
MIVTMHQILNMPEFSENIRDKRARTEIATAEAGVLQGFEKRTTLFPPFRLTDDSQGGIKG